MIGADSAWNYNYLVKFSINDSADYTQKLTFMGTSTGYIGTGCAAFIVSSNMAYIGGTMKTYPGTTARTWAYTAMWPPHYYFPYTTQSTITVKVNAVA